MVLSTLPGTGDELCPSPAGSCEQRHSSSGATVVELAIVLGIISCVLGASLPALTNAAEAKRTRDAAGFLAGQFRLARHRAVTNGRNAGIVFDELQGGVGWRLCEDKDLDGLSRDDILVGTDACDGQVQFLSDRFAEVGVAYHDGIPSPDGVFNASPLTFGTAKMAVFTPAGTASSGTVAIAGPGKNQFAVRVAGVTARTRVLRFDPGTGLWAE